MDEIFYFPSKKTPSIHALKVLNKSEKMFLQTEFGIVPVGPVLNYQCSLIPTDFNIYSNPHTVNEFGFNFLRFPDLPFGNTKNNIQS